MNRAVDWLLTQQSADGSFGGDTDQTGAAIEALNAAGRHKTPQQAKALQYLRARQNPDGGFAQSSPGDISNTSSTAWVLRGLKAAKIQAASIRAAGSGKTPLDYLAAMRQPDGSIPTSATNRSNLAFSTAFTTPALNRRLVPHPRGPARGAAAHRAAVRRAAEDAGRRRRAARRRRHRRRWRRRRDLRRRR